MGEKFGPMVVMYPIGATDEVCESIIPPPVLNKPPMTPEQRLWLAVIVEAIACLRSRRHRGLARVWLLSKQETPFSFRWAITMLGFDANAFQDRLATLIHTGKAKKIRLQRRGMQ